MNDLVAAIGLVLVIEGLVYAGAPGWLKRTMLRAQELPDATLRAGGVAAAGTGLFVVWLVRG